MGKRERDKGNRFERSLVKALKNLFPLACRGLQFRGEDRDGCDIESTPYHIEAKNCKHWRIQSWFEDIEKKASVARPPVLICNRERKEPLVVIAFSEWLRLAEKLPR